jgi:hypothetical protein
MQIEFEFETDHGRYCDALNLPDDHSFTDEEIQAMKQQRLGNWLAVVTTPPEDPNVIDVEAKIIDEVI